MTMKKAIRPPSYTDLRLYTFCNFYLSSIQQGIQSAHVVSELFHVYADDCDDDVMLRSWAEFHKTIIVCNGGMGSDIVEGHELLAQAVQGKYPIASFNEEPAALGGVMMTNKDFDEGVMTAFGIVLPNTVYDADAVIGRYGHTGAWEFTLPNGVKHRWAVNSVEAKIMNYVSTKSLAR